MMLYVSPGHELAARGLLDCGQELHECRTTLGEDDPRTEQARAHYLEARTVLRMMTRPDPGRAA